MTSDFELEKLVIGQCLLDPKKPIEAIEILADKEGVFVNTHMEIAFWSMCELSKANQPIDLMSVSTKAKKHKLYDNHKDIAYQLSQAMSNVGSSANFKTHIFLLAEYWIRRKLISLSAYLNEQSAYDKTDVFDIMASTEKKLIDMQRSVAISKPADIGAILSDVVVKAIQSSTENKPMGLSTGYPAIDSQLGRLMPGTLGIIAARPGMGKSALSMGIAENVARSGNRVAFFSIEMSKEDLAARLISSHTSIPANIITQRPHELTTDQKHQLDRSASSFKIPIQIIEDPYITGLKLKAKIRQLADEGLSLVIIDYLQLMRPETIEQRMDTNKFFEELTADLKAYSKEFSLPIIALSQLSREVEKRGDKRPMLSDLRSSGGIEQNADWVTFLYRSGYYDGNTADTQPLEVIVSKNRGGGIGTAHLTMIMSLTKVVDGVMSYQPDNFTPAIPSRFFATDTGSPF